MARTGRASLVAASCAALVGLVLGISPADAKPERTGSKKATTTRTWAPADQATITPGSEMVTDGGQCTANFVFTAGSDVLIGYAAHCAAADGGPTDTNGCDTPSLPTDGSTKVRIEGASKRGTLVYSSWEAMQRTRERRTVACEHNDFALVRIHPDDHGKVNPSIPHWGGPVGLDTDGTDDGEAVYSYGNSGLRLGIRALSPKAGASMGSTAAGWVHPVDTFTPGIPGDSGSALLDAKGRAAGVLSTLVIFPDTGANNYSDLSRALDYMRTHGGPDARLALGTKRFDGDRLPLGVGL